MKNLTDKLPPRAEWDFSKCPKELLHHCVAFEYGRHIEGLKEVYSVAKKVNDGFSKDRSWRMDLRLRRRVPKTLGLFETPVKLAKGFPAVPFLNSRTDRLSAPNESSDNESDFDISWKVAKAEYELATQVESIFGFPAGWPEDGPFPQARGNAALATFLISFDQPKKELERLFRQWLDRHHPDKEPRGKSRFRKWKACLNDLAAFRILQTETGERRMTAEAAIDATAALGKPIFANPGEWRTAAKRAKKAIELWSQAAKAYPGFYQEKLAFKTSPFNRDGSLK